MSRQPKMTLATLGEQTALDTATATLDSRGATISVWRRINKDGRLIAMAAALETEAVKLHLAARRLIEDTLPAPARSPHQKPMRDSGELTAYRAVRNALKAMPAGQARRDLRKVANLIDYRRRHPESAAADVGATVIRTAKPARRRPAAEVR